MKVEDKRKELKNVRFIDLSVGDTFEYDDELWVKINGDEAFSLTNDWTDDFGDRIPVLKVNVKIVVEN